MHYRKALESILITGLEIRSPPPASPDWLTFGGARMELTITGLLPNTADAHEILEALRNFAHARQRIPLTAADLEPAERLAIARATIAAATPEQLADLAVCVDAAISGRGVTEYRNPADVAQIAELEDA